MAGRVPSPRPRDRARRSMRDSRDDPACHPLASTTRYYPDIPRNIQLLVIDCFCCMCNCRVGRSPANAGKIFSTLESPHFPGFFSRCFSPGRTARNVGGRSTAAHTARALATAGEPSPATAPSPARRSPATSPSPARRRPEPRLPPARAPLAIVQSPRAIAQSPAATAPAATPARDSPPRSARRARRAGFDRHPTQ